jgi:EAL domain-containing protein (putative c-di-GMP-specific phosphodiesterase class I)
LRDALGSGHIDIVLQPIVDLRSGHAVGFESLARWNCGDVVVGPDHFLPILHRAGLFDDFAAVVINRSLSAWARLVAAVPELGESSPEQPYISINIHPHQLTGEHFVDTMTALVHDSGAVTQNVVLEITEDALADAPLVVDALVALRARGFRIAIDDFGTGYSSLGQAVALPLDILKIDRSFIPRGGVDEASGRLFGDLVGIGRTLGARLVAEGVETPEAATSLTELGVEYGQGYHFARPMPVDALIEWLMTAAAPRA